MIDNKNEKRYYLSLKESELRELQLALMYHIDSVMIPYLEKIARERDYHPTMDLRKRIETLQRVMDQLNREAGPYTEKGNLQFDTSGNS